MHHFHYGNQRADTSESPSSTLAVMITASVVAEVRLLKVTLARVLRLPASKDGSTPIRPDRPRVRPRRTAPRGTWPAFPLVAPAPEGRCTTGDPGARACHVGP